MPSRVSGCDLHTGVLGKGSWGGDPGVCMETGNPEEKRTTKRKNPNSGTGISWGRKMEPREVALSPSTVILRINWVIRIADSCPHPPVPPGLLTQRLWKWDPESPAHAHAH